MAQAVYPPGPRGNRLFGQVVPFRTDPLGFLARCAQEYGDVVHFTVGRRHVFLLNDPEHIRHVLVQRHQDFHKGSGRQRARLMLGDGLLTSQGAFHLRQRRLLQPAFHRKYIAGFATAMVDLTRHFMDRWADGATYDMAQEMMELTYGIILHILFGVDVAAKTDVDRTLSELVELQTRLLRRRFIPFVKILDRLPTPTNRRFAALLRDLDAALYRMIADRRSNPDAWHDMLGMLLQQTTSENDPAGPGIGMTDKQARDEAITLFVAGHETMASALAWTWYAVSRHPDVERKLHAELDAVLGGRPPTFEDVPRLAYTAQVLNESMRLFPPVWIITRQAVTESEIGGYAIPRGSLVLMTTYTLHRSAASFPEPERFDPDRWSSEAQNARPRFSYIPFGAGPRQCIGEPLALLEGVLTIATIAQRWRMRVAGDHPVEPEPLITLRPRRGLPMRLERRSDVASETGTRQPAEPVSATVGKE